jgi:hypothetical protein
MGVDISEKQQSYLLDSNNPFYLYDLLGVLKSSFIGRFFIQPGTEECPPIKKVVDFARSISAIPAYAYLGDVTDSPTGDKKAEKFEDDYIGLLFEEITALGFQAVTYMPPRNTLRQLHRVQKLCAEYGLMQISGVDINSPRQVFSCPIILEDDFRHLADATWALIAHEKCADADERYGLFHPENPFRDNDLDERLNLYNRAGRQIDPARPEGAAEIVSRI